MTAEQTISERVENVIAQAIDAWLATHCFSCHRPAATEADWERYDDDEAQGVDLCWEPDTTTAIGQCWQSCEVSVGAHLSAVLAPVVAEAKAEAWHEGYAAYAREASSFDGETYTPIPNPYRPESTGGAA